MPYSAEITRSNPTCFLFLIDQSKSMLGRMDGGNGRTKAESVADSINSLLYNLCLACVKGQTVLDRFSVGVIGYGLHVGPALGGALANRELVPVSEMSHHPLRVERSQSGGVAASFPVWFDPVGLGKTPMCAALDRATAILSGFLRDHPDCHPPVVINLTDGEATDGDPEGPAGELRQLSSTDGNVLLFNAHISSQGGPVVLFPDTEDDLADSYARRLFRMSSVLPPPMRALAQQVGYASKPATRGFVFNANLDSVVQFLNVGTTVSRKNV
jgi:hypothetical protein